MICECTKGELIKLKKFYVCDECARILSFEQVTTLAVESTGAFSRKPKGKYIIFSHPEHPGYLKYEHKELSEWRNEYRLFGKNKVFVGVLLMQDYTESEYITCSPLNSLTTFTENDGWRLPVTKSLDIGDISIK